MANFELPINLTQTCFRTVGGGWNTLRELTQAYGEHANSPQKSSSWDLNPVPYTLMWCLMELKLMIHSESLAGFKK